MQRFIGRFNLCQPRHLSLNDLCNLCDCDTSQRLFDSSNGKGGGGEGGQRIADGGDTSLIIQPFIIHFLGKPVENYIFNND